MTRGKGEGSIYQRKADGRWVGSFALRPDQDGNRKRRVVYGRTRREVLTRLDRARAEHGLGVLFVPHRERVTVGMLLDEWLASVQRPAAKQREMTSAQYVVAANTRIRDQLGHLSIIELTDDVLTRWQDVLLAAGYAPRSVLKARTVLSGLIKLARKRHLLLADPLDLVEAPSTRKPVKRAITDQEAVRLLRALRGHPLETLFLADLLVGARRGEILGWTWSNIDLDAATVRIALQIQRVSDPAARKRKDSRREHGTSRQLVDLKTESSIRVLPLPSLLVERLRQHPRRVDTDLVFATNRGLPIEPRQFNLVFKTLIERCGLAPLTPHELRHSFSTTLQHLGVRPAVVASLLGHADPSVTLRWYTHDVPADERDAMDRMDRHIRNLDTNGYTDGYQSTAEIGISR